MKFKLTVALICALFTLVFGVFGATSLAQESPPADPDPAATEGEEPPPEVPVEEYKVKAYSLAFWGGWFSGGTFLELQPLADRTQLEEGSDLIWKYNGDVFTDQELNQGDWVYDGARKEILPGVAMGGIIGMYLSEHFHLDIEASISKSRAITTFNNNDPSNLEGPYREELDADEDFTVYMGGLNMVYDAKTFSLDGIYPFVGFGIGGIINRFSELEDKTALFFQMFGGINFPLAESLMLFTQLNATTFSFGTEELQYGKQVTYTTWRMGLNWVINVVPGS